MSLVFVGTYPDGILNQVFRNVSLAAPATPYLGLHLTEPADNGSITAEVSAGGYARTGVVFGTAAATGRVSNTALCAFPTATADWGAVPWFGFHTASSAGSVMAKGLLRPQQTIVAGNAPSFAVGEISAAIADGTLAGLAGTTGYLTDYAINKIVNQLFRNVAQTWPATVYMALLSALPAKDGTGFAELSGTGYARVAAAFAASSGGVIRPSADVVVSNAAGGNWGTLRAYAIMDAVSAGNALAYGLMVSQYVISTGMPVVFDATQTAVSLPALA